MCGRYGRRADKQRIAEWFQTHNTDVFNDPEPLAPSYNIAPQSFQPVVRFDPASGERELTFMRWGLIPFWAKDSKMAFNTINAKAETITTSSVYREAAKHRRCLVPVDWFYEWKKLDERTKQPYAIGMKDDGLFAFAGLWDSWKDNRAVPVRFNFDEEFCVVIETHSDVRASAFLVFRLRSCCKIAA